MPRAVRRPGPPSIYFGVWGTGDTTTENITALLDDYIEGLGECTPHFVVPLEKDASTPAILDVAAYAIDKGYALEVVYEKKPTTKDLKEILVAAAKEHVAEDANAPDVNFTPTEDPLLDTLVVAISEKPENGRLLFFYPAEDAGAQEVEDNDRALFAGVDQGVIVLDLTQGLDRLGADVGDAGPDDGTEPAADDNEKPVTEAEAITVAVFNEWPIRRMRTHAKEIAEQDREDKVPDVPSDDDLDAMGKDDLRAYVFPDAEPAAEPEPTPAPKKTTGRGRAAAETEEKSITPARAKEMREEGEAAGTDGTTRRRAAGAAKKAAETPPEPETSEETSNGPDDGEGHLEALVEAVVDFMQADVDDTEAFDAAVMNIADCFADHIIYRIAKRIEREPEGSDVRKEIAPPRPPGKPRADGEAPTRRRTARS